MSLITLVKGEIKKIQNKRRAFGALLLYLSVLVLLHALMFQKVTNPYLQPVPATWRFFFSDLTQNVTGNNLGGGMIGALIYGVFYFLFDQVGTYFIIALLLLTAVLLIFNISYGQFFQRISSWLEDLLEGVKKRSQKKAVNKKNKTSKKAQDLKDTSSLQESQKEAGKIPIDSHQSSLTRSKKNDRSDVGESQREAVKENNIPGASPETEEVENKDDFHIISESENEDYVLPPLKLLNEVKSSDQSNEYEVIERNIQKLEDTFESFDVDAKVVKANLGPAVTKYEIQPATGVKVSKIVSLQDDIALALAAKDIRIEAPIPGRALIGIEVPNQDISFVSFRETLEMTQRKPDALLEVPIGKDISGNIQIADLSKMPHLLIAGSTGSGKSVAINSIITALLMRTKPSEVKLMMIDPKMVELNDYNGVPHLLTPVVTNPKKAARALNNVVKEMERRYELFASTGTKNRATYNDYVSKYNREEKESLPFLPYIVVIVDELADLMMVASKEVEDAIMRLAQMARAAGIHMILATQRPSVDVLTGTIKANIPSRIAFAVSSGTDSRTILDMVGAEKLLGKGDMLYLPMGTSQAKRVQGTFITDDEVKEVVEFVKNQQEVNYVEEMIPSEEADTQLHEEPEDEYFDEAVNLVIEEETASVSMLQRRFRIGYNRAARLIDDMEARGIVGPPNGSKPRDVLIDKDIPDTGQPVDQEQEN
ncbi:MAG: DNA translocase FtsK [Atopococcus tabaci]|uniref:DNA translocase FtsK n=1 Tax=Atopococcus tabaci TaxID=269774 RepID=A0AA43RLW1_9LACT|nr:DNA translocase FtsK [Atopococcus tabaci]